MRPDHCTITPASVRALAAVALARALPWRGTPGVSGGQKKHGTKYAFGYATAVLVHLRHRFTVGLLPLTGGEKPHEVVQALLGQIQRRGLRLRGVVLDSGFDSGDVLLLPRGRRTLSYTVPLRKKGKGK